MKKAESFININANGASISISTKVGEIKSSNTWKEIINNEVQCRCSETEDGPLLITADTDSVEELTELSDKLREAADEIQAVIKSKEILLAIDRPRILTYQQYIRGEY
jgi:hypothetical protein